MLLLLIYQLFSIYKTKKKILIYKKYICNSGQKDFNLFTNHIYAKIVIVFAIDTDLLKRQYNMVMQAAKCSSE